MRTFKEVLKETGDENCGPLYIYSPSIMIYTKTKESYFNLSDYIVESIVGGMLVLIPRRKSVKSCRNKI